HPSFLYILSIIPRPPTPTLFPYTTLFRSCYVIVPRIMTSIEGDPLLIEDLEGRRFELQSDLSNIENKANDTTRRIINDKVRRHFFSAGYLLRQYTQREELTASLAKEIGRAHV